VPRLTARERREGYLREYSYQQRTGKPFFPYALFHDVAANCFFVFLIVGLTCLWYFTAKHGVDINHGGKSGVLGTLYEARADPAIETYDPRPEWYFFFLFELLRLFQNPELLLFATIIIPTFFMVLLIGMPFIDRSRERRLSRSPVSIALAGGMAVLLLSLTWYGSKAPGAAVAGSTKLAFTANLPCASCHSMKAATGWNGNIGPNLDGAQPTYALAVDRITNGKGVMPAFKNSPGFTKAKIDCIATFVATESRGGNDDAKLGGSPSSPTVACKGIS
jgi:menaquinol-cytochrome c reductase cytochrome b/c subunit